MDTTGTCWSDINTTRSATFTVLTGAWGSRSISSYGWNTQFQGMQYDAVAGNYNQREAPIYPALGRWATLDPVGLKEADVNLLLIRSKQPYQSNGSFG